MILDKNNKTLSEILLMTGLTSFFGLLNYYIPPIPFLASLLAPIPVIWLVVKYGLITSLLSLLGAAFLMLISGGTFYSVIIILVQSGLLGIVIGLLFKNRVSGKNTVAATLAAASVAALVGLALTVLTAGGDFWLAEGDIQDVLDQVVTFYRETGVIQDVNNAQAMVVLEDMIRMSALLFPGSIVLWSMGSALLTLFIARIVLSKFQFEVMQIPSFSEWSLSWISVWGLILGLTATLIGDEMSWFYMAAAGKNLLFVFGFVYMLLGASFVAFLFKTYNLSRPIKIIAVVIAVLYWPVTLILCLILGGVDTLLNLRGRIGEKGARR